MRISVSVPGSGMVLMNSTPRRVKPVPLVCAVQVAPPVLVCRMVPADCSLTGPRRPAAGGVDQLEGGPCDHAPAGGVTRFPDPSARAVSASPEDAKSLLLGRLGLTVIQRNETQRCGIVTGGDQGCRDLQRVRRAKWVELDDSLCPVSHGVDR